MKRWCWNLELREIDVGRSCCNKLEWTPINYNTSVIQLQSNHLADSTSQQSFVSLFVGNSSEVLLEVFFSFSVGIGRLKPTFYWLIRPTHSRYLSSCYPECQRVYHSLRHLNGAVRSFWPWRSAKGLLNALIMLSTWNCCPTRWRRYSTIIRKESYDFTMVSSYQQRNVSDALMM